jgi:hypothetical protein
MWISQLRISDMSLFAKISGVSWRQSRPAN